MFSRYPGGKAIHLILPKTQAKKDLMVICMLNINKFQAFFLPVLIIFRQADSHTQPPALASYQTRLVEKPRPHSKHVYYHTANVLPIWDIVFRNEQFPTIHFQSHLPLNCNYFHCYFESIGLTNTNVQYWNNPSSL